MQIPGVRNGDAPSTLFSGGGGGAEFHAGLREVQCDTALFLARHQAFGGGTRWAAVSPRPRIHASDRSRADGAAASSISLQPFDVCQAIVAGFCPQGATETRH